MSRSRRGPGCGTSLRRWTLSQGDRQALTRVVGAFLLTRLLLYVVGAIAIRMVPAGPSAEASLGRNLSLVPWVWWDAVWYLSIAERGYWFDPHGPSNVAFFPLLPLLIKGVALLTGNVVVAGLLVSNLAALGAILALWRWVRAEAGPVAAEQAVLWLLVYPFSFFFHSIYAESLFFLLATLALEREARAGSDWRRDSGLAWPRPPVPWASCSRPRWPGGSGGTGGRAAISVYAT